MKNNITETVKLKSYNIKGQEKRSGVLSFDEFNKRVTFPSGKTFTICIDKGGEYTYKLSKKAKTIIARGGIDGFRKFINEINTSNSPFNPCYTDLFLKL